MLRVAPSLALLGVLVIISCGDKEPSSKASSARRDAASVIHSGRGYAFKIPNGYTVSGADDPSTEVIAERIYRAGEYTANVAVVRPPRGLISSSLQNDVDTRACGELGLHLHKEARGRLIGTRIVKLGWGATCEVELDRPRIGATVVTTVMKTSFGPVLVVGHHAHGDAAARQDYDLLTTSWQVRD